MKKSEVKKIDRFLKNLEEMRIYFISKAESSEVLEDMLYGLGAVQELKESLEEMREPKLEKPTPKLLEW